MAKAVYGPDFLKAICSDCDRIVEITDATIEKLKQNDRELQAIVAKLREPIERLTGGQAR